MGGRRRARAISPRAQAVLRNPYQDIGRTNMKRTMKISHAIAAAVVAGSALFAAGTASAQVVYGVAQQPSYEAPHAIPVDVSISVGWHGDRYWDGHRYWAHDDWMRRHPHDHDPHRDDHRGGDYH
jgi:hypothetical protein